METWKSVVGFESHYEVSNLGAVRSLDCTQSSYGGRKWVKRGKLMKLTEVKDRGYLVVSLNVDGNKQRKYVHDLVLSAFIGPRPEGAQACHGARGPGCNTVTNLRWDTPSANTMDKHAQGTMPLGESHWKNVYTETALRESVALMKSGMSVAETSRQTGVSAGTLSQVKNGRQWKQIWDDVTSSISIR